MPAGSGWPPLARRTEAVRRIREASRRCSALLCCMHQQQPPRHGVRAQQARVLRLLLRDSERSGALARATRRPDHAASGAQQLTRRTMSARRRRGASRRCNGLPYCMDRPHPSQHDARAQQPRVLRLLPRDSERSGALTRATRKPADYRRPSWHVAPRPCAEEERPLAGAAPFCGSWTDQNQRRMGRARSSLVCCASFRETASAIVRPCVPRESRLIVGGHR